MMFEYPFDIRADDDILHGIAQQVACHAHAAGMREFYEYSEVRTVLPQDRMRRMPDTLPTEDPAARFDLGPLGIESVTAMTDPLGPKLPGLAMTASLHQEPVLP